MPSNAVGAFGLVRGGVATYPAQPDFRANTIMQSAAAPVQGPGTDEAPLEELRRATRQGQACVVQLMNYRKNGDAFVNYLSVTPIHDSAGVLTHYVGIQSDITQLVKHKKAELAAKHAAVQVRLSCSAEPPSHMYLPS